MAEKQTIEHSTETRQRILAAAAEVFAEHGFGGAGVDEIARRAGVNKAMLYYHVGDKAALFGEVVSASVGRIAEAVASALAATDDPRERLRAIPRAFAQVVRERPFLPQLMLREVAAGGPNLPPHVLERMADVMGMTKAVLEEGYSKGAFRKVDPLVTHLLLIGTMMFLANALRMRERFSDALGHPIEVPTELGAMADQMVDIALNGIAQNEARGGN
jgi:TetR/AcrR family transcriptional regulator